MRTALSASPAPDTCAMAAVAGLAPGSLLGRIGAMEVRLANGESEIRAAQELRSRVFHEELGAKAAAA